jgi:hypothetical protein
VLDLTRVTWSACHYKRGNWGSALSFLTFKAAMMAA